MSSITPAPDATPATTELTDLPIEQLLAHHRALVSCQRDARHWHHLLSARLDLAIAAVAALEEPRDPEPGRHPSGAAPEHLRQLVGLVLEDEARRHETTLLLHLRTALIELETYALDLHQRIEQAAKVVADRVGSVRVQV